MKCRRQEEDKKNTHTHLYMCTALCIWDRGWIYKRVSYLVSFLPNFSECKFCFLVNCSMKLLLSKTVLGLSRCQPTSTTFPHENGIQVNGEMKCVAAEVNWEQYATEIAEGSPHDAGASHMEMIRSNCSESGLSN